MSESAAGSGVSIFTAVGVILIVMKLVGAVDWPWWLVLLPFWGPLAVLLLVVTIVVSIILVRGDSGE